MGETCMECGEIFPHTHALIMHVKSIHYDTGFECVLCDKKFEQKTALDEHRRSLVCVYAWKRLKEATCFE